MLTQQRRSFTAAGVASFGNKSSFKCCRTMVNGIEGSCRRLRGNPARKSFFGILQRKLARRAPAGHQGLATPGNRLQGRTALPLTPQATRARQAYPDRDRTVPNTSRKSHPEIHTPESIEPAAAPCELRDRSVEQHEGDRMALRAKRSIPEEKGATQLLTVARLITMRSTPDGLCRKGARGPAW